MGWYICTTYKVWRSVGVTNKYLICGIKKFNDKIFKYIGELSGELIFKNFDIVLYICCIPYTGYTFIKLRLIFLGEKCDQIKIS